MESQASGPEQRHPLSYHGGDIAAAMRLFPDAPTPWIDLSTGINAVPFPVGDLPASLWSRLPGPSDVEGLEAAARHAYRAACSAEVVAAPGTQALIQWLPRVFPARNVGLLGFTYAEHELCWQGSGASITTETELAALAEYDVGVVVNPNNPDGRMVCPKTLNKFAYAMARRGGRLIVDEAFIDLEQPTNSFVPTLPTEGAIVLRSFGKTYGLAGLRLGFAVGSTADCARLRRALGPWPVSGPAIEIGRRALMDDAWRVRAAQRLGDERARLDEVLQRAGFDIVGGTLLFRLARHRDAVSVFDRLCRAGILVRPFEKLPSQLRFGIPHRDEDWKRLIGALEPLNTLGSSPR